MARRLGDTEDYMNSTTRPLAMVTGASTGIGYELARCCAENGFDLLIVADQPEINQAAEDLRGLGARVEAMEADLATIEGVEKFYALANGRPIDVLLANAGHGLGGAFLDQDFKTVLHVINTNITGTIYLAQRVARDMRSRGAGRILFTGSVAGYIPGSFSAVYNGTKAFVDSFSFALRNELKDTGITVTCLMPGATETEFFERAGMMDTKVGQQEKDDPADVAKAGFEAMMNGEGDVVTGWKNKLMTTMATVTPSGMLAEKHRRQAEPGSANKQDSRETMKEKVLTQDLIDGAVDEGKSAGLYAKVAKHPFITGGLVLAGAGLAYAAGRMMMSSADDDVARDVHIETAITINRSPEELYAFWRELTNLPLFMKNLTSVTDLGGGRSHWVAKGIGGSAVEWDAEIFNEIENELIAWRSLPEADVINAGSVRFESGPAGHGTFVRVTINYNPPAGMIGSTIAKIFGAEPKQLIHEDLRRLKQIIETGEVATIDGQTSGRSETESGAEEKTATMGDPETNRAANSQAA